MHHKEDTGVNLLKVLAVTNMLIFCVTVLLHKKEVELSPTNSAMLARFFYKTASNNRCAYFFVHAKVYVLHQTSST